MSSSPSWGKYALWRHARETALLCSHTIWLHIKFEPCVTLMWPTLYNNGSMNTRIHSLSHAHLCTHTCACSCRLFLLLTTPFSFPSFFLSSNLTQVLSFFILIFFQAVNISFSFLHIIYCNMLFLPFNSTIAQKYTLRIGYWCCVRAPSHPPKPMSIMRIC